MDGNLDLWIKMIKKLMDESPNLWIHSHRAIFYHSVYVYA